LDKNSFESAKLDYAINLIILWCNLLQKGLLLEAPLLLKSFSSKQQIELLARCPMFLGKLFPYRTASQIYH
jgi:hypothetical protein